MECGLLFSFDPRTGGKTLGMSALLGMSVEEECLGVNGFFLAPSRVE
jgi:hypothetical protein